MLRLWTNFSVLLVSILTLGMFCSGVAQTDNHKSLDKYAPLADDADSVAASGFNNPLGDFAVLASEYTDFRMFIQELSERPFRSSAEIDWVLYKVKEINAEALSQAWLAYNVLIVSEHPEFRESVFATADYYGRSSFAEGVKNDLNYARSLEGSENSIATAFRIAHSDVKQMNNVSRQLKQQAHTLQSKRWATHRYKEVRRPKAVKISPARKTTILEDVVSTLGDEPINSLQEVTKANSEGNQGSSSPSKFRVDLTRDDNASFTARTTIANKITTLAALKVLGINSLDQYPEDLTQPDEAAVKCFKRAQLNLQQCLSAAHLRFEVPFCIAQHGVMEKGKCISQ